MTCRKGPGMVVVFISAFIEHWKDSCANFFFDMAILRNFKKFSTQNGLIFMEKM